MSLTPDRAAVGPYQGLKGFTEDDADFFFGRDTDRQIVCANLLGSRLTILYGGSGVGKSSLLRAGVARSLRRLSKENRERRGSPRHALVVFDAWREDPVAGLRRATAEALADALGKEPGTGEARPTDLADFFRACSEEVGGHLLIVLDQFEEHFLYPARTGRPEFGPNFARAVNDENLRVNFLLSIREDALARIDSFKPLIPNLFDNYLRLNRLDRESGRAAICGPLLEFARQGGDGPSEIEPALVEEVLNQVAANRERQGQIQVERPSPSAQAGSSEIESPYLQLVMQRLWREEQRLWSEEQSRDSSRGARDERRSRTLRLHTFVTSLGGGERIVREHVDTTLATLDDDDQAVTEKLIKLLVTAEGSKIARTTADLQADLGCRPESLQPVLERLSAQDARILRSAPDLRGAQQWEIFHDVLGPALRAWRQRYTEAQGNAEKQIERSRRRRMKVAWSAVASIMLAALVTSAFLFDRQARAKIRNFKDQVFLLEKQNARLEADLKAAKDYLEDAREGRTSPIASTTAADSGPLTKLRNQCAEKPLESRTICADELVSSCRLIADQIRRGAGAH